VVVACSVGLEERKTDTHFSYTLDFLHFLRRHLMLETVHLEEMSTFLKL